MSLAFYNEIDPFAAAWLRELIAKGHIAPGVVDERSITEIDPHELHAYRQVHLFAGIGGWSFALRLAGWPDDRPVWTGSCPCQPYSAAGRGLGDADPRNLWPAMFGLVRECRPVVCFGEQVASAIGHGWLDRVSTDLEGEGYAVGAAVLGAHSVGAPHIRQRLYWVADAELSAGRTGAVDRGDTRGETGVGDEGPTRSGKHRAACHRDLADAESDGREQRRAEPDGRSAVSGRVLVDADVREPAQEPTRHHAIDEQRPPLWGRSEQSARLGAAGGAGSGPDPEGAAGRCDGRDEGRAGDHRNGWSGFDLVACRDGKARRVEPGSFPLAHGVPARVGRLRGYGNAIVPEAAAAFVVSVVEALAHLKQLNAFGDAALPASPALNV